MADIGEIDIAHGEMLEHTAGCSDDDVGAAFERGFLSAPYFTVGAAIDSDGADGYKIAEAFHLLIDLDGKFASRDENDGVYAGMRLSDNGVYCRQEIGGSLACASLRAGDEVVAVHDDRYCLFLDGSWDIKTHGVKTIQHFVGEVEVVEMHDIRKP